MAMLRLCGSTGAAGSRPHRLRKIRIFTFRYWQLGLDIGNPALLYQPDPLGRQTSPLTSQKPGLPPAFCKVTGIKLGTAGRVNAFPYVKSSEILR